MLTVSNWSPHAFKGWQPFTVPALTDDFPHEVAAVSTTHEGQLEQFHLQRGSRVGAARTVWLRHEGLPAGAVRHLDLSTAVGLDEIPAPLALPPAMASDPVAYLQVRVNGQLCEPVVRPGQTSWLEVDGPAFRVQFRGYIGSATWVDVFVCWVPSEPWFRWEALVNCAHQQRPALFEDHANGLTITVGTAALALFGGRPAPFGRGMRLIQGAARSFAGIGAWLDLMGEQDHASAACLLSGGPFGVESKWRDTIGGLGIMGEPAGGDLNNHAEQFVAQNYGNALASMGTSGGVPNIGVAPNSAVTGNQEAEGYGSCGVECFATNTAGPVSAFIRYLVALTYSRRPCHWRENDGELLRWDEHPNLVLWSGRPHWHPNVGSDKLGLSSVDVSLVDSGGWFGPDRQHWFYGDLWTASMLTGSRLLQVLLEAQARLVWFGETVALNMSTSHFDSARSVGWFGILATSLMHCLDDREAKRRVRLRARERVDSVYLPELTSTDYPQVWHRIQGDARLITPMRHHYEDVRLNDGTVLGRVEGPMPPEIAQRAVTWRLVSAWPEGQTITWQQSLGAFGLLMLCRALGEYVPGMQLAFDGGVSAFVAGWRRTGPGGAWQEWETVAVPDDHGVMPFAEMVNGAGAFRSGMFRQWAMPLAAWVAARNGFGDAQAVEDVLRAEGCNPRWLPPANLAPSIG